MGIVTAGDRVLRASKLSSGSLDVTINFVGSSFYKDSKIDQREKYA